MTPVAVTKSPTLDNTQHCWMRTGQVIEARNSEEGTARSLTSQHRAECEPFLHLDNPAEASQLR